MKFAITYNTGLIILPKINIFTVKHFQYNIFLYIFEIKISKVSKLVKNGKIDTQSLIKLEWFLNRDLFK